MSGVKKLRLLGGALIVLFLLNSCTDFFSESWGKPRDPAKVKVDESNVEELLKIARGNPELSKAILDKIDANSSDKLKHAAIKAANQAAGIPSLALENVKILTDAVNDHKYETALEEVAEAIQDAVAQNDLVGISDKLSEILGGAITKPSEPDEEPIPPEFTNDFLDNVSEADLTLMVMTLVLAKAQKVKDLYENEDFTFSDYINGKTVNGEYIEGLREKDVINGIGLDPDERVMAAIVNEMVEKHGGSDLVQMLEDLLGRNNTK
jgi:hypothetical protein